MLGESCRSIEEFQHYNPADRYFAESMESHPEYPPKTSPALFMANLYLKAATKGIENSTFDLTHQVYSLRSRGDEFRKSFYINKGAAILAASVISIEQQMIARGVFDENMFNDLYFSAYGKASSCPETDNITLIPEAREVKLTNQEIKKIVEEAVEDRTLTSFFRDDQIHRLPISLQIFLNESNFLLWPHDLLITGFKERVNLLRKAREEEKATAQV